MSARGPRLLALVLAALVGVAAWQVSQIPPAPGFNVVGPEKMPIALVGLLAALVALYSIQAMRGVAPDAAEDPESAPEPGAAARLGWALLGLLGLASLAAPLGIGVAAWLAFLAVARAFGSRRLRRDALVGLGLTTLVWALFSYGLGLTLGPFARLPAGL